MTETSSRYRLAAWVSPLVIFAVLLFVLLFVCGGGLVEVIVGDATDGLILLAWLLSGLGIGWTLCRNATVAATPASPSRQASHDAGDAGAAATRNGNTAPILDPLLLLVTRVALGLGVLGLATLGLGLAGLLRQAFALGLLAIGVFLLLWQCRRMNFGDVNARFTGRSPQYFAACLLAAPLAVAVLGASLFPGLLWKPLDPHPYDVMSYHLQIPREWFDAGRIIPLHHNAFSYFPMGMEMHDLLAMHVLGGPWAAMYLCQFMSLAMGGLTVLGVVGAVRQFGGHPTIAWLCGLMTACVPWTLMLSSVAYVEPAVMLYTLLAAVWAMVGLRSAGIRPMAVAGTMAGFACGAKYTSFAMIAVPLVAIWPLVAWRIRVRQLWRPWLTAAVACGVVASPWLIRNIVWTGNPVFPLATGIFGRAHFTQDQVDRYRTAHAPPVAERPVPQRLKAAVDRVLIDPEYGYLFPALVIAAFLMAAVQRQHLLLLSLIVVLALVWLLATHDMPRFLTPAIPLGAVLVGIVLPRAKAAQAAIGGLLVVQSVFGVFWTWQHLSPRLDLGRQGFFRLPTPAMFDSPELANAKAAGAKVAMIGDCQAFFQALPSDRLLYRGVFDVNIPPGVSTADGWLGESIDSLRRRGYWVIVNTDELDRLSRTYAHIPKPTPPYDQPGEEPKILPPLGSGS